jgi:hypothetical protein
MKYAVEMGSVVQAFRSKQGGFTDSVVLHMTAFISQNKESMTKN